MFSRNDKSNDNLAIFRRRAIILLAALAVGVIGSEGLTVRASTLGEAAGQVQQADDNVGANSPNATCPAGGQCFADVTSGNPFYAFVNRIYQQDLVSGYPCGGPGELCDSNSRPYYRPNNTVTRQQMAKFIDNARRISQIDIEQASGSMPIIARNGAGTAIGAYSTGGQALVAQSSTQSAIYAQSGNSTVISAYSTGGATSIGVAGAANIGVKGSGILTGVLGVSSASGGYGVYGMTGADGTGVYGYANTGVGVIGYSATGMEGVYGSAGTGAGVFAHSATGDGLIATSNSGEGVVASSGGTLPAISAVADGGNGIFSTSIDGYGIYASSVHNDAGHFDGNVTVNGNCCSSAESTTRIDDPLDPANKVLNQSLVQSPNMMDILDGNTTTDASGIAIVQLPPYFQALNTDFRYQLTVIGQFAQAIVSTKIANNSFSIKTDKPNVEVSWQVTGVRQDPYAAAHPIQPEQAKPANEQGKYLYPTEYGQPALLGVDYDKEQQAQQSPNKAP